jgi:hypothetical protein
MIQSDKQKKNKVSKVLQNNTLEQFTPDEIKNFKEYNNNITTLDPYYSSLKPRNRKVLVRVYAKDFEKNSDNVLVYSKTEFLPIVSGVNQSIIYDDFPNPYPLTRKAIIVASEVMGLDVGSIVSLSRKPTVGIGKQDSGYVQVQDSFVHPEKEENYNECPQDASDPNYGYLLINETQIELTF